jgi:hypothetical protein
VATHDLLSRPNLAAAPPGGIAHGYLLSPALSFGLFFVLSFVLSIRPAPSAAQRYVAGADTAHPRIIYADSLTSLNDRCAVRQTKMALMRKPVYVNGRPVGFC